MNFSICNLLQSRATVLNDEFKQNNYGKLVGVKDESPFSQMKRENKFKDGNVVFATNPLPDDVRTKKFAKPKVKKKFTAPKQEERAILNMTDHKYKVSDTFNSVVENKKTAPSKTISVVGVNRIPLLQNVDAVKNMLYMNDAKERVNCTNINPTYYNVSKENPYENTNKDENIQIIVNKL